MVLRARVASLILLLTALAPPTPAAADEPPSTTDDRRIEVHPGSLTTSEPWIAYPGDYVGVGAIVWPTESGFGPIPIESCTWDFGDGEVSEGVSDRRPGWCRLGKQWRSPGSYPVHLTLRDSEGRDWAGTYVVEVRERTVVERTLRRGRTARIRAEAPTGTVWDLRRTPVEDSSENAPPCRLRTQAPHPKVSCARRGTWVLVGRDAATGWSLHVDLVVRARRR